MNNGWIKCENKMPEPQQRVLAYCNNYITILEYIPYRTVKAEDYLPKDVEIHLDYDSENDVDWMEQGWYEDDWEYEDTLGMLASLIFTYEGVTHWMPLPNYPQ